ncbi:saccharopine dehydrogenase family protein [[Eubacterium] cellulosolvens]
MQATGEVHKYTYAVLGAGRQGTAAAYDMVRFGNARKVVLGDIDSKVAKKAADRVNLLCGRKAAEGVSVDVRRPAELKRFLTGIDAFLSAVPYYYNLDVAKAAVRAGASMCDLGGHTDIVRKELLLDREAKDAGISIVPDCGLGPGMGASLACYGMELLDEPREVYIWEGGLPQNPRPPFNYLMTFNFEGLVNEYSGMAVFLRGGEIVEVPSIEELEIVEFPQPIGRLEAFTTSGGTSTCPWTFKGKLKIFQNKTLRYPGSFAQLQTMRDLGLFSDKELKIDRSRIVPRRVLQVLFEPKIKLPGEKDVVVLRVRCVGEKNKQEAEVVLDVVDYYDDQTRFTAMERTTGWHASMVAIMMAHGETPRGAKPLEIAVPGHSFVEELKRRGIKLSERTSWPST